MATRQKDKIGPSRVIGTVSKFAGTVVGTAVVTGKRIVRNVRPVSRGFSNELEEKSVQAPAKKKKKATRKKETKGRKKKKKKKTEKGKSSSRPQNRPISRVGTKTSVAVKARKSQPPVTEAKLHSGKSRRAGASTDSVS